MVEINFGKSAEEQLVNYAAMQIKQEFDDIISDEIYYKSTGIPSQRMIDRTKSRLRSAQIELENYQEYRQKGCWPFNKHYSIRECDKEINNCKVLIYTNKKLLAQYEKKLALHNRKNNNNLSILYNS